MPRLGVNALRWLLLLVNVGALFGMGYFAVGLVLKGSEEQLAIELPDASKFVVPEEGQRPFDAGKLNNLLRIHKTEKPIPVQPKPVTPKEDLPAMQSGPLDSWEIASTTATGPYRAMTIQQKVETNVVTAPTAGRNTRRATRGRTPSSRSRTNRSRSVRRPSPAAAQQTRYVRQGGTFTIDGLEYTAERIELEPEALEYRDPAGRRYRLEREKVELTGLDFDENGKISMLIGAEDDGSETNLPQGAVPPSQDNRGEVRRPAKPAPRTTPPKPNARPGRQGTDAGSARARQAAEAADRAKAARMRANDPNSRMSPEEREKAIYQGGGNRPRNR